MKKTFTRITALLTVLSLCFLLAACNVKPGNDEKPEAGAPTTFVGIDINPSIELTLDENGIVATVYGANEDGKILLFGEEDSILGKDYEAAAEYITNLAVELGYIEEGHKISATVSSSDPEAAASIEEKIKAKITSTADGLGFTVNLTSEAAYSLLRDLEALKEQYPDDAAIQGLTPEKFKLVASVSENGDITVTAAAKLSDEELIAKVNEAHSVIEHYATEAYMAAKARAEMLYEVAMGVALDGVYTTVYLNRLSKIMTNPSYINTFYYGAVYQAYKTTARTFDALDDIMEFGEEMTSYELDEATVNAIATELGIEDTSVLENEEGKITVKSAIEYSERFLDENELSDEVEDRIEEILDTAEDAAEMVALSSEAYAADLAALKVTIETIVANVNSSATPFLPLLSDEAKAELEVCLADLNTTVEKIGVMMDEGLTDEELEELVDYAEDKALAMLTKIKADLSEEELAEAKALEENAKATVDKLTKEFTERLTAAENAAKAELERKHNERKNYANK